MSTMANNFKRPRKGALLFAAQGFEQIADAMAVSGIESIIFDGHRMTIKVVDHEPVLEIPVGTGNRIMNPQRLRAAAAKAAEMAEHEH